MSGFVCVGSNPTDVDYFYECLYFRSASGAPLVERGAVKSFVTHLLSGPGIETQRNRRHG